MDDAFRLAASHVTRTRRLSTFGVRVVVAAAAGVVLSASFGAFVVRQERVADGRRAAATASRAAAATTELQAATASATSTPTEDAVDEILDRRAQAAATSALETARGLIRSASADAAAASELSRSNRDVVFVDGPSTGASVVSVFAGASTWAAAVHGSGSSCFWIALSSRGDPRYGTGSPCTGIAALAADRPSW